MPKLRPTLLVALIYDPPPAAPLPRPEGSKVTVEVARSTPGQPVVEEPRRAKLGAPMQVTAEMPQEIELEPAASPKDKAGDETGSDRGDPLGMEAGVDNGMVGGVPEGKVGGVPGGTGMAPVLNYDTPPRIIRQTRPRYPQEAFVKKVEGTVVVEIVIDPSGRVSRARVIQSVPLLDAAAIETVHEWLFQPAVKRGRLVPAIGRAPVRFVIY